MHARVSQRSSWSNIRALLLLIDDDFCSIPTGEQNIAMNMSVCLHAYLRNQMLHVTCGHTQLGHPWWTVVALQCVMYFRF